MSPELGKSPKILNNKVFLISQICSPSFSFRARRTFEPPELLRIEISDFCWIGTTSDDPLSLKKRCGFIGNRGMDFGRDSLTAPIQVGSSNSMHRGSIPAPKTLMTAFAASYNQHVPRVSYKLPEEGVHGTYSIRFKCDCTNNFLLR